MYANRGFELERRGTRPPPKSPPAIVAPRRFGMDSNGCLVKKAGEFSLAGTVGAKSSNGSFLALGFLERFSES